MLEGSEQYLGLRVQGTHVEIEETESKSGYYM